MGGYLGQSDGANQPGNDPRAVLANYISQVKLLKERLDDFEDRRIFTHITIGGFVTSFESLRKGIAQLKDTLSSPEKEKCIPLLNGIRYALPVLAQAEKERAKNDDMNVKCHNLIIQAVKYLESALDK